MRKITLGVLVLLVVFFSGFKLGKRSAMKSPVLSPRSAIAYTAIAEKQAEDEQNYSLAACLCFVMGADAEGTTADLSGAIADYVNEKRAGATP